MEVQVRLILGFPKKVQNIFTRIHSGLNESDYTLNFEEFVVAANNLFNELSLEDKDFLIKFWADPRKVIQIENSNFQV